MIIDRNHSRSRSIPLQWLILLAFIVQIFGAVGLVAYLSYRSGQESANKLALRLKTEISTRVTEKTTTYLQAIDQVNKNNVIEEISRFLRTIDIQAGTVFIMDSDQTLVATSLLIQNPSQPLQNAKEQKLLKAIDSPNLQINSAAKYLRDRNGNLANIRQAEQFELEINGDRQLVQATPLRDRNGLDWIIVVVLPESDFMADIQANEAVTKLLCGIILLVTIGLSIITTRWVTKPILRLSQASKALATGDWQEPLAENNAIAEINSLSQSFNQMATQVRKSFEYVEVSLQESTEKYRTLFQVLPIGIAITDPDGKVIESNPASEKILGVSTQELSEHTVDSPKFNPVRADYSPIPFEEYTCARALRENCFLEGVEVRFIHPNGSLRWLSESASPIPLKKYGVVISYADISDRKQAELDLQTSKTKLNDILNSATASITRLIVKADGNFEVDYISDGCEAVSGYTANELIEDQSLWLSRANPEDWQAVESQVYENIFAERSGTYIYRLQHKDGSWRWISQINSSRWDSLLNAWVVTIISTDISDRKQIEIALNQSEQNNRAILNAIPDLLLKVRRDGSCLDFIPPLSDQAGTFFPVEKHISEVLPPDLLKLELQGIAQALETGELQIWEHQIIKNGQICYEELRAFPCGIDECLVIVRDISARKLTELALVEAKIAAEAATKAKSEFLASMSHEIRTPMNGVIGMTQILGMTELTTDQQEFVKTIKDSGEALLTIINDILDFSKIESGMLEIESKDFDLEEVIRGVCNLLENQTITKQIDLKYAIAPDIPKTMIGDLARLRQVLLNLVGNAVKFTQKGQVSISVSGKDMQGKYALTFAIADTGIGIARDRLDLLFQAFTQADNSISREYGGTGLGLAISKRLVNLMEGTIWVESLGQVGGSPPINWKPQPLNPSEFQGSTFYFTTTLLINQTITAY